MQEILIANLTLDTTRRNNIAPLIVPQGDYGARVIRAEITNLGKPVNVESTAAVSIVATRSGDGESLAFSGRANEDGTVTVPVTQWMLDIPDEDVICHVVVTGNGYQYSTTSFLIEPQEKANPTEISADDPRVDVVTEVLANENARQAAEAERQANENARKTAENARQSAETQRLTDEATRITNEAQRVSAEASRDTTFKSWANDIALLPDMSARISRNSKRLDGLEQRIKPSPFVFDETVAYQKDVPSNAVGAAEIHKIGGMTYKSKNLIPFPYVSTSGTINGATATINTDQSITISGTPTVFSQFRIFNGSLKLTKDSTISAKGLYGGSIGMVLLVDGVEKYLSQDNDRLLLSAGSTITIININIGASTTGTHTISVMLNEGSTAQPYESYFEGLRSAKVTEVKSVGANLFDESILTDAATWQRAEIKAQPSTTYTAFGNIPTQEGIGVYVFNSTGTATGALNQLWNNIARTFTTNEDGIIKVQWINLNGTYSFKDFNFQINKGQTAQPYSTYQKHTLPIPEALRPANGINAEVYDSIEWSKDGRVKTKRVKCGVVAFDGTENITFQDNISMFVLTLPKESYQLSSGHGGAGLCNIYDVFTGIHNNILDRNIIIAPLTITANKLLAFVKDSRFATVEAFTKYLSDLNGLGSPLQIVYQLATPEVTDVSDLITSDNLLKIQALGTITAENEDRQAVPFTVEYITAESDE